MSRTWPGPSRRLVAVVVLAVLVLSMGAALAATRDDGEASPERAAQRTLDALGAGDLVGALASLPPGERRVLAEPLGELVTELQRLGLIDRVDPSRVAGVRLQLEGVELHTTMLSDSVAAVDLVAGRIDGGTDPGGLPFTAHLRELLDRVVGVDVDQPAEVHRDLSEQPLRLMVVHEGGGWHVSLAYTLAEAARQASGAPMPEFGVGPDAIGADTPEAVVRDLVKAYADSDVERAVTLTYPVEARALYDYAPVFVPPVQRAGRQADDEGAYDAQINGVELQVEGTGGSRRVRITAYDVDLRDELVKTHVTFDGRCVFQDARFGEGAMPFESYQSCDGEPTSDGAAARPRDNPLSYLAVFGGGTQLPTFTVVERNGRWFLSPMGSLLSSAVDTLRATSPSQVDALAQRIGPSLEQLADPDDGIGPAGGPADPINDVDRLAARCRALADRAARRPDATPTTRRDVLDACRAHLVATDRLPADEAPPPA